jgi:hypothetical protein
LPASARNSLTELEDLVKNEHAILGGNSTQKNLMQGVVDNVRQGRTMAAEEQTELRRNELRRNDEGGR